MTEKVYVAIMAGGVGSRFWPYSKTDRPKQFLDILGLGKTLLQLTYERFARIFPPEDIFVVTNESYTNLVKKQIPALKKSHIIGEPMRKNTAPCIGFTAWRMAKKDPHGLMVVAPADHMILETDIFEKNLKEAVEFANHLDSLVTLGIQPTRPDTGYGYIQYLSEGEGPVKRVKTFTEKPNKELAEQFIQSGDFLWNSGIFIWSLASIKAAFNKYMSDEAEIFEGGQKYYNGLREKKFMREAFRLCPSISIDYGIMERAENVFVVPSSFNWCDLGTWASLYANQVKDENGNVIKHEQSLMQNTKECIVYSENEKKLIVLQDVNDLIVVDTDDTLLISNRASEQKVKHTVNELAVKGLDKYL